MFGPHYFINQVQSLKHTMVDTFVKDGTLKQEMRKLIDAQTQFYHSTIDASLSIMAASIKNFNVKQ
jgi:hypothetical protein